MYICLRTFLQDISALPGGGMHLFRLGALLFVVLSLSASLSAQQTTSTSGPPVTRDAQAVLILGQALAVMGGAPPTDSVATGTIAIVAGSKSDDGTIRTLTRGADQSAEHIQLHGEADGVIYSRGQANEVVRGATRVSS